MGQQSSTIRVSTELRDAVKELAQNQGVSMQVVLEAAVKQYQRQRLFDELDAACRKMKEDPVVWEEEEKERRVWDNTLSDGLEDF